MSARLARVDRGFLTAGGLMLLLGLVLTGVGLLGGPQDLTQLANSYVFAWTAWTCLTFGFLGLTLLHHATRGHWGFTVVRLFEAGSSPLALLVSAVGFVPIALMAPSIYPWARPAEVAADPILQGRMPYMSFGLWAARAVVFFAILIALSWWMAKSNREEEVTGRPNWQRRSVMAALGLVVYTIVVNFAWTDWTMSRESHWFSTIYGLWFIVGGALMAFGLTAAIVGSQHDKEPYDKVAEPWLLKDLGNLMLATTMLWAYFSFSQYLIIWSGNLPVFTKYFIARTDGMWLWLGNALILTQFFIPFVLLLSPTMKRKPLAFAGVGGFIFVNRFFDWFFIIVPTYRSAIGVQLLDVALLLLFGGLWCAQFGVALRRAPLIMYRRPNLEELAESV